MATAGLRTEWLENQVELLLSNADPVIWARRVTVIGARSWIPF